MVDLKFQGAQVLGPDGLAERDLAIRGERITNHSQGKSVVLPGYLLLPGIVDLHGDGFERHLAPRRGAMKQMAEGLVAVDAELAANGITTAVLAQFVSWEGGLRGLEFADQVFQAIRDTAPELITDLRAQLRFETHQLDLYDSLPDRIAAWDVDYVVFNDHLPHRRLAEGRKPPRMVGQALKAGRNPEDHFALMQRLHAARDQVPDALDALCSRLAARGIRMGSHDDATEAQRSRWHARGVAIAEFPETQDAAQAARSAGDKIVLGAPNVVRGGSHNGNVSALDLIAMGLCDALASDYHYPSPRRAALMLAKSGVADFAESWRLISEGPAAVLGLTDRGQLKPGDRADLVILDERTHRVAATLVAGRFSYLSGDIADRFFAA
ncbi:alpha-D-ribose 1-methylphosphonate 5-triphosphate diphosphatase [uncultured Roseobacter sp.]|uniref:alpha-D-ribose 1-methylphosphonate 5-triphosphate diphosphatase n=1 Tax=uncultured Roseobacter sp. TaxID=114847 RepID=UPI00263037E9|nr:alpha-D-ribose 1-methylphosphonate 5-triphosphate diphosphatase [uncultured Roseobacter sp.]